MSRVWGESAGVHPTRLRTEYAKCPLGIDERKPRLSWVVAAGQRGTMQSAYQVLVTSDPDPLAGDTGAVWDSGCVQSGANYVDYAGEPLESSRRYYWRVRVWGTAGLPSAWSKAAWWEMGLLDEADWLASWISAPRVPCGLLARRVFKLRAPDRVESARLYVSGLGYYELYLNATRLGDSVLDPGFTDYTKRVLYRTYDATPLLAANNAISVALGRGWYGFGAKSFFRWDQAPWHGDPTLLLQLHVRYSDGAETTVRTDETWRVSTHGPTVEESVFGEVYDARKCSPGWTSYEFDDTGWAWAVRVAGPRGRLRAQQHEPITIVDTMDAVTVTEATPGAFVYDFGQIVAGWVRLTVVGPAGTEVRLSYSEVDNPVTFHRARSLYSNQVSPSPFAQYQQDKYVLVGNDEECWEPRWSYKGFRYVELTGFPGEPRPSSLQARVVHSSVASAGEFDCSDELLNKIHRACRRSIESNIHGILTDSPVYEKAGWTADAMMTATPAMYNFDLARLFIKWFADFRDAQADSGEVPAFVPTSGWGKDGTGSGGELKFDAGPTPDFDSAYIVVPWEMYWHYGDVRVLRENLSAMTRYMRYLERFAERYLLDYGLGDWQKPGCADEGGPSAPSAFPNVSPALLATAHYYRNATIIVQVARLTGDQTTAEAYSLLQTAIKRAFNNAFLDPVDATYKTKPGASYSQTSNAVALAFGLAPDQYRPRVVAGLVEDIRRRDNHLDTGIQGTSVLLPVLSDNGRVDLAYEIARQTSYPSWGHWILAHDAVTLYESWSLDARSRNHHFFSSIERWFYQNLAGIRPAAPGFRDMTIRPQIPAALRSARATVRTVSGDVSSGWERHGDGTLRLQVDIPANTTAVVHMPAPTRAAVASPDAVLVRVDEDRVVYRVLSGQHVFRSG